MEDKNMKKTKAVFGFIFILLVSLFAFTGCGKKMDLAWRDNSTHVVFGPNNYYIDILNQTDTSIENVAVTFYYSYKPGILDDIIETSKDFFIAEIVPLAVLSSGYRINFSSESCFSSSKITKVTYLDVNGKSVTMDKVN